MKKYELVIKYKNGEVDKYYSRLTGDYWKTEEETAEDALVEMRLVDPETFESIENSTTIESVYVVEVKDTEISVGMTYDDPEGTWEIVAIDGDEIEVKCIRSKAVFDSTMTVIRDEVEYFLTHDWQTDEVK